ncbi:oxidative stress-responsive serine-rich protein 1-like isoform X2 [Hemicordylus capensis]|nr:oxidative stress-responsive serine-rich protein 1-like isoform X2 [Hemicordylus capensis]XP_053101519.1 oxidative stress-responsive serine-rich protein 1-like isoform X2 [Hemicordylus capensis]
MLEIEENLQAAFKKLRVDAERSTALLPVNEATSPRALVRTTEETKVKNVCANKESWHWCVKKPLRGIVRTQRHRQSKSPILHPPKFIHCSPQTSSGSPPMHKSPSDTSESSPGLDVVAPKESAKNDQASHPLGNADQKQASAEHSGVSTVEISNKQPPNRPADVCLPTAILKATGFSDFHSVSEQNIGNLCMCTDEACQCKQWQDMKRYMFSGLQHSRQSASERPAHVQESTQSFPLRTSSSSLKSCSEQARAYVDDVTMEDLSGYMECFLYIPKKMSHMAEMMYT